MGFKESGQMTGTESGYSTWSTQCHIHTLTGAGLVWVYENPGSFPGLWGGKGEFWETLTGVTLGPHPEQRSSLTLRKTSTGLCTQGFVCSVSVESQLPWSRACTESCLRPPQWEVGFRKPEAQQHLMMVAAYVPWWPKSFQFYHPPKHRFFSLFLESQKIPSQIKTEAEPNMSHKAQSREQWPWQHYTHTFKSSQGSIRWFLSWW